MTDLQATVSTDLSAALTVARDVTQTFDAALNLLDDTDLMPIPGSPNLEPPVSGSKSPPIPYHGDQGLRGHVLRALRQCHDAAAILCQLDECDDPLPWEEAPQTDRTVLPSLTEIHRHLTHLDLALADVQRHIHGLAPQDREIALHACGALTEPPDTGLTHRSWDRMARRARMQCEQCWRLSGRAVLCQECSNPGPSCKGTPGVICGRRIPEKHTHCPACRQRMSRARRVA